MMLGWLWCLLIAGVFLGDGLSIGAAGCLSALALYQHRSIWHRAGWWCFLLFVVTGIVSAYPIVKPVPHGIPFNYLHWLFLPLVPLTYVRLTLEEQHRVLKWIMVFSVAASCLAWIQSLGLVSFQWLSWLKPTQRVLEPGWIRFKAGGFHFHRLKYAHTLLFLAVPFLFQQRSYRFMLVLPLVAGILAQTYAALLGSLLLLALWLVKERVSKKTFSHICQFTTCVFLITPVFGGLLSHLGIDRFFAWQCADTLVARFTWLGVGVGKYPASALAACGFDAQHMLIHYDAHSLLLQILAERGVVGLLLVALPAVVACRSSFLSASAWSLICIGSFLGMVHNWFFHPVVFIAFMASLGMCYCNAK